MILVLCALCSTLRSPRMAWRNIASVTFHPVGQGLFSSGMLFRSPRDIEPRFSWVYDCGTVTSTSLVNHAIDQMVDRWWWTRVSTARPKLDLLVLSHFDKDHISGVVTLLSRFRVGTLLIPLVPLWQRLALLFGRKGYAPKDAVSYLLDPLGYISRIEGADIGRVIFVPSADGDGIPPPNPDEPPFPPGDQRQGADKGHPRFDDSDLVASPEIRPLDEDVDTLGTTVPRRFTAFELPVGGRLTLPGLWEFVPYHDPLATVRVDPAFVALANALRRDLLASTSEPTRKSALQRLKRHYHTKHRTGKTRNALSLFLYAGILEPFSNAAHVRQRVKAHCGSATEPTHMIRWSFSRQRSGVLYTGDGYVNAPEKWAQIARYLGPERIGSLTTLQVMHHGSRHNWHPGLAASVNAPYAVFSADHGHKRFKHPEKVVVDDFRACSKVARVDRLVDFDAISIW